MNNTHEKTSEEQILSQNFNQLNITLTEESTTVLQNLKNNIENLPDYLSKRNKAFQEIVSQIQSMSDHAMNIQQLRKIIILLYRLTIIPIYYRLWTTYLKSGIGELIVSCPETIKNLYTMNISIWPKEIIDIVNNLTRKKNINDSEIFFKFVSCQLRYLEQQLKQFQMELNIEVNKLSCYTLSIQKIIETYLEEHLQSFCLEIEHRIELVQYDYHIRALKIEFLRHKPDTYQQHLMKDICQCEYERETSEQEYQFIRNQIVYYNLSSQSFSSSTLLSSHSQLIDSIDDTIVRQNILTQFKEVAEQSRMVLLNLYLKTAEEQYEEYKTKYEMIINRIRSEQFSNEHNTKPNISMINQLIEHRAKQISERIKCIYKFKNYMYKSKL